MWMKGRGAAACRGLHCRRFFFDFHTLHRVRPLPRSGAATRWRETFRSVDAPPLWYTDAEKSPQLPNFPTGTNDQEQSQ